MKILHNINYGILAPIKYRDLFQQLLRREIQKRYRGSLFGGLWSFLNPLLLLIVYTVVFSVVFQAKWGTEIENRGQFSIIFFCGLIVYGVFNEIINSAPYLITDRPNLVKKIVFPLELLTHVSLINSIIHALISIIILFFLKITLALSEVWPNLSMVNINTVIPITAVLLPIVWLPMIGWCLAIGWILSAAGVYFKDIRNLTSLLSLILLFLSPIFYPIDRLPTMLVKWLKLNPLAILIEQTREVLLWGQIPNFGPWLIYLIFSFLSAYFSYIFFIKVKPGFADVT